MIIDYPILEFLRSVVRRYNPPRIETRTVCFGTNVSVSAPEITIGFVGDICPLFGKNVQWGDGIQSMLSGCDRLVGNFEGCITDARARRFRLLHDPSILEHLNMIAPPERWMLGVANNHSGDFGSTGFEDTCRNLDDSGYEWFGTRQKPKAVLLDGMFGISAWSRWLNRPNSDVPRADPGPAGVYSIAYPHWGYEFTSSPDASMELLPGYDLVIGHHTHLPLPIESQPDGRMIAWSLGNFTTGNPLPALHSGAVVLASWALAPRPIMTRLRFEPLTIHCSEADTVQVQLRAS